MSLTVKHNGKTWETDEGGFRIDNCPFDIEPDEDWYDYVRIKYGIPDLTSEHLKILEYIQDYYRNNGISPSLYKISNELKIKKKSIHKLFPTAKAIIMMAGLPRPTGPDMSDKGWVRNSQLMPAKAKKWYYEASLNEECLHEVSLPFKNYKTEDDVFRGAFETRSVNNKRRRHRRY